MTRQTRQSSKQQLWQTHLINGIADLQTLLDFVQLKPGQLLDLPDKTSPFPLKIPYGFAAKIKKADPRDPILLQVLPQAQERIQMPGYSTDPVTEIKHNNQPGLIHKYRNRVLLTAAGQCAIHCRFCFRRHFPYQDNNPGQSGWQKIWAYIEKKPEINEVILSGGDPLLVTDQRLQYFVENIEKIKHIKRLRIHSRLPIVLPERFTEKCIAILTNSRLQTLLVVHSNHSQEIDDTVRNTCIQLWQSGITLLNHSVLLAGINDHADKLTDLSEALADSHIMPYYLNYLDKVAGSHHFYVPLTRAQAIMRQLQQQLPGYLVPKLVIDQANHAHKTPIPLYSLAEIQEK